MKSIHRDEVLDPATYERARDGLLEQVIAEKKKRRLLVSNEVSVLFENRMTVLSQIHEMLRAERITSEEGIRHEIETYNELIPSEHELSATMFIEIADKAEREKRLVELAGLERHLGLWMDGTMVRTRFDARSLLPDRTTAVHYLKFPLGPRLAERFRQAREEVEIAWVIDHPRLSVRTAFPPHLVRALAEDLA